LATAAPAQTLEEVRNEIRGLVDGSRYAAFVASLIDVASDLELSAARLTIDSDPELELSTFKFPYQSTIEIPNWSPALHIEANFGYLSGRTIFQDIWSGSSPAIATRVDSTWTAYSGLGGVGLEIPLAEGLTLTPIADLSLSYVRNDTNFSGPGAAVTQAVTDGILFNYNTTLITYGGALRAVYDRDLSDSIALHSILRYDLRQTNGISSTDPVQDPSVLTQRFTARADVVGPTGLEVLGNDVNWRTITGYTRFLGSTADILGFTDYFELGAGIEEDFDGMLGPVSRLSFSTSVLLGADVFGWSIGAGFSF